MALTTYTSSAILLPLPEGRVVPKVYNYYEETLLGDLSSLIFREDKKNKVCLIPSGIENKWLLTAHKVRLAAKKTKGRWQDVKLSYNW